MVVLNNINWVSVFVNLLLKFCCIDFKMDWYMIVFIYGWIWKVENL